MANSQSRTPPMPEKRLLADRRDRKRRKHFGAPPTDEDWNPVDRRDNNRRFTIRREDDRLKGTADEEEMILKMEDDQNAPEEDTL